MRRLRLPLPGSLPAHRTVALVRDDERPFALTGAWAGGGAIAGSEPVRLAGEDEDPFALLAELPRIEAAPAGDEGPVGPPSPAGDEAAAVGGGWFGYLGYGLGARLERLDPPPPRPPLLPSFALAFYDHVVRMDGEGRWWFEALVTPEREAAILARRDLFAARLLDPPAERALSTAGWVAEPGAAGHAVVVGAARARIHAGDLFQANLSLVLRSQLRGEAADLFAAGVRALAPDRAAFLGGAWGSVASLSPELFLSRRGRSVRSSPIKGTRPRPADPAAAERERRALLASDKDHAENVMIVDLVRNDLGRVCETGSVRVPSLASAEAHSGVWHLVSTVEGRLRDGVDDGDLVRAAFPPGSVTGAPKVAAMNVIAELESSGRAAYTGAIGFASPLAGLELSVAIRTFEHRDGELALAVGGGVVADSDPEIEAAEALGKAAPLLRAIGGEARAQAAPQTPAAAPPPRVSPRPVPRPDPDRGVFETMRVEDGTVVAAQLHLQRLAASVAELYGLSLPAGIVVAVEAAAAAAAAGDSGPVRLRLEARPQGRGGLATDIAVRPLGPPVGGDRLAPVTVPGGLGAHKWIDRRLLEAMEAHVGDAQPLLVDADGFVLEAARTCVFAVLGDMLLTPPADGRILPGVGRHRVLDLARREGVAVDERPLPLSALASAPEVFLVSALRGVRPIRGGPVGRRFRATLSGSPVGAG
jgi:para-aminobenzoate synthetase/4-amino-4-deoxychorismate lyase